MLHSAMACPSRVGTATATGAGNTVALKSMPQRNLQTRAVPRSKKEDRITTRQNGTRKATGPEQEQGGSKLRDQLYFNFIGFPFPLGPVLRRKTIRREVTPGVMWTFEQAQTFAGFRTSTNIRMTVIKLLSGVLWVHAPIAPTAECIRLMRELGFPVGYIVLTTYAYEHKVFVGPFSRKFPRAKVYVPPRTWSFPLNLPLQALGIFPSGILTTDDPDVPWAGEIQQKVLQASLGAAPYVEVSFFHKPTRTLLVTDAVVSIPAQPPATVSSSELLFQASSNFYVRTLVGPQRAAEPLPDVPLRPRELTPAAAQLGWRRAVLLVLYFRPGDLRDPRASFGALAERLIVGPVLRVLVFPAISAAARDWVGAMCGEWDFRRVIPAHFDAPVRAGPADLRAAFQFLWDGPEGAVEAVERPALGWAGLLRRLRPGGVNGPAPVEYDARDMQALRSLHAFLVRLRVLRPPDGGLGV
uniref:Uncharacterized protein n=1 Tax=Auxenochlorella protothecoides TaxID=3075 RepID=A0A1D2ABJ0_AUXPR